MLILPQSRLQGLGHRDVRKSDHDSVTPVHACRFLKALDLLGTGQIFGLWVSTKWMKEAQPRL